jgi:hypothetical protein
MLYQLGMHVFDCVWPLYVRCGVQYFVHTVILIMLLAGASHWCLMNYALPRSGLQLRTRKPQNMAALQRAEADSKKVSWSDRLYNKIADF